MKTRGCLLYRRVSVMLCELRTMAVLV